VHALEIVIAHPDPSFRERLRSHLQQPHLRIQTRAETVDLHDTKLLIAPLELLPVTPQTCGVLALVDPNLLQAAGSSETGAITNGSRRADFNRTGFNRTGLNHTGFNHTGLNRTGLNRAVLNRCDDFLLLPCNTNELQLRVQKLLNTTPKTALPQAPIEIGEVRLDPQAQRIWFQNNELELTRREFELLEVLMRNAGRVVHKNELLRSAWGEDFAGKVRTVDQHILQVRQHLHDHARDSRYIVTVHGRGYMFVEQSP
jgi:DNA-binding winged helix-turn-helix (wHTH) protein